MIFVPNPRFRSKLIQISNFSSPKILILTPGEEEGEGDEEGDQEGDEDGVRYFLSN